LYDNGRCQACNFAVEAVGQPRLISMGDRQAPARRAASDKLRTEIAECCMQTFGLHKAGGDLFKAYSDFAALNDNGCVEAVFKIEECDTKSDKVKSTWTITMNADQPDERRGAHYGYKVDRAGVGKGVTGHVDLPAGVLLKYNRGPRPSDVPKTSPRGFGPGQKTQGGTPSHPTTFKVSGYGYYLLNAH